MEENLEQPYSIHEVERKIKEIVNLLQESNSASEKFKKIEEYEKFILSRKQFRLTESQIDYLFEGNEEENIQGLCQFAGRKQYMQKQVKRSSISALNMIYTLLTQSGNFLLKSLK